MLITTVSTLFCLGVFLVIYAINESEKYLLGLCFVVSILCCVYLTYWLLSYITKDLDELFERQGKLIERLSGLSYRNEQE